MAAAMLAAAGLNAFGKVLGGVLTRKAAGERRKALRAAAKQTRQEASVEASAMADEVERAAARAAVVGSKAGGGWAGSAGDVLRDQEQRGRFNVRSAIWQGETRAQALEHEGDVARQEGRIALMTSFIEAGSTLLSAFGQNAELGRQAGFRTQLRRLGG